MIYFVRHGQTINNVEDVFYDQTFGPELTEEGVVQAEEMATKLKNVKFDICYCSPRKRTIQTLDIIKKFHPNLEVKFDDRIAERCWGEVMNKPTSLCNPNRWNRYKQFSYKRIETVDEIYNRLKSFYQEINDKNKNILVVSHSGIYRVSYCYFNGFPKNNDLGVIKLKNGQLAMFK